MDVFLQQVLNGLTLGGIYGLVALGLTLVYGIMHVPNFAHGGFYMIGAFVALHAMVAWSWGYWSAMVMAVFINIPMVSRETYESETQLYRISLDYSIWT